MTLSTNYELKIKLNEKTIEALSEAVKAKDHPENLDRCLKDGHATVEEIKSFYTFIKGGSLRLHEILSESDLELPVPEVTPRSPELEARIEKLKARVQDLEYRAMTRNVSPATKRPEDSIAFQMSYMNRQLIAVGQFIFSVAAGFAFGFIGIELIVGNLDFGFRLLLGVICALIIALAEIYFLAKIIAEMDEEPGEKLKEKVQPHPSEKLHQD